MRLGSGSLAGYPRPNRMLDDRHEKAKRFAGTCTCRHDEALSRRGFCNRLRLMAMEPNALTDDSKDLPRFGA